MVAASKPTFQATHAHSSTSPHRSAQTKKTSAKGLFCTSGPREISSFSKARTHKCYAMKKQIKYNTDVNAPEYQGENRGEFRGEISGTFGEIR